MKNQTQSRLAASSTTTWATTEYDEEILFGQDMMGDTVAMGIRETVEHPDGSFTVTERAGDGTVLRTYGSAVNAQRMEYTEDDVNVFVRQMTLLSS